MLLDDSEVHLTAGDFLVQQATNHAWVNRSDKVCRIAFVLIDGTIHSPDPEKCERFSEKVMRKKVNRDP